MIEKYLANRHLLVAEDNVTNQIVVTKMIEVLGGTYDLAVDGVEAIELYTAGKYDLALLDIEMPRKSGLEVIRHIRSDPNTPDNFPVLALTAFVLGEHKVKIRDAGASAILSKPIVDVAEFGRSIARYFKDKTDTLTASDMGINIDALDDLKNSLGPEITNELVDNLDKDLEKIYKRLSALSAPIDKEIIRVDTHSLLSLAGMAGATSLVEITQNLNDEYAGLSDDELLSASSDIVKKIDGLRTYLTKWMQG